MATRVSKSTEYVRHVFTEAERLEMGNDLASSYSRIGAIEEEEQAIKAKFKERKTTLEQKIGSLSRDLTAGWTMQNVDCKLVYDSPNTYEVSYVRLDSGETVRTRAMTDDERQMELPLPGDVVVVAPEKSAENIEAFFGKDEAVASDEGEEVETTEEEAGAPESDPNEFSEEPLDPFSDPDPAAAKEALKPENDEAFEGKKKPKGPKGFSKPTNQSAF